MSAPQDPSPEPTTAGSRTIKGHVLAFFRELRDDFANNAPGPAWHWHDMVTFLTVAVLLTVFYYWCRPGFFRGALYTNTLDVLGISRTFEYSRVLPYTYWAIMSVVVRMLIPLAIIWFVFKGKARDYGYRIVGVTNHAYIYLLLYAAMLPILYFVSTLEGFQRKYPFYKNAILGWDHFWFYQLSYGVQFVALEAFFRGFIIFALFKRFGYYSLFIMVIPYSMIHYGKPPAETFGAILAGLLLGYLALKSKSWFYGAMLHWSIGVTMDLLSIFQKGGFKS